MNELEFDDSEEFELEFDDHEIRELSNEEYHSRPELSCSSLKTILTNPYMYVAGIKPKRSASMDFGSAVHKLLLEPYDFDKEFAVIPKLDLRKKLDREKKVEFETLNAGKIWLTPEDFESAEFCTTVAKQVAGKFFENGEPETSIFGLYCLTDAEMVHHTEAELIKPFLETLPIGDTRFIYYRDTRTGKLYVGVRVRPDYLFKREEGYVIVDVKTTQDASADGFLRSIAKFGYYIQEPFYRDVATAQGYPVVDFIFVAIETKPPYMIGVWRLGEVSREFGRKEYKRALEIYQNIDQYTAPLYKDTATGEVVQTLELPNYVFYRNGASM